MNRNTPDRFAGSARIYHCPASGKWHRAPRTPKPRSKVTRTPSEARDNARSHASAHTLGEMASLAAHSRKIASASRRFGHKLNPPVVKQPVVQAPGRGHRERLALHRRGRSRQTEKTQLRKSRKRDSTGFLPPPVAGNC